MFENTESTRRQYALRERAVALGWPVERVIVIDDLGFPVPAADARVFRAGRRGRDGRGRDRARARGLAPGPQLTDWHRLLEICALTDTLILDEDGLYNPSDFNDRLLLGLKGTMSEAELHVLRARLRGGTAKARRGALR